MEMMSKNSRNEIDCKQIGSDRDELMKWKVLAWLKRINKDSVSSTQTFNSIYDDELRLKKFFSPIKY